LRPNGGVIFANDPHLAFNIAKRLRVLRWCFIGGYGRKQNPTLTLIMVRIFVVRIKKGRVDGLKWTWFF